MNKRIILIIAISIIVIIGLVTALSPILNQKIHQEIYDKLGSQYQDIEFVKDSNQIPKLKHIDVFDILSKYTWKNSACFDTTSMFAPTCINIELKRDGSYKWTVHSDALERKQNGTWNFILNSEKSGLVFFDNGSVIPFVLQNDELIFGYKTLVADSTIDYSFEQLEKSYDDLQKNTPSELYLQLLEDKWHKTNDFGTSYLPDVLSFEDNGRFFASYRNEQCSHEGTWGLDNSMLISISDPNICDMRGNISANIAASNATPSVSDDMLYFFSGAYQLLPNYENQKVFSHTFESIKVTGKYYESMQAGIPKEIEFVFTNVSDKKTTLENFAVILYICEVKFRTGCNDPTRTSDITKDYGIALEPNESYSDTVEITSTSGVNLMQMALNFDDFEHEKRRFDFRETVVVR